VHWKRPRHGDARSSSSSGASLLAAWQEALISAGDAAKPFCEAQGCRAMQGSGSEPRAPSSVGKELDRELLAAEREDREQWLRCLDGHKPSSEDARERQRAEKNQVWKMRFPCAGALAVPGPGGPEARHEACTKEARPGPKDDARLP